MTPRKPKSRPGGTWIWCPAGKSVFFRDTAKARRAAREGMRRKRERDKLKVDGLTDAQVKSLMDEVVP